MNIITGVLVPTLVIFCSLSVVMAEHSFLPAPQMQSVLEQSKALSKSPGYTMPHGSSSTRRVVMGMGLRTGMTVRQEDKKKPICPQFFLSYAKVRKATFFLRRKLAPSERRYKRCKDCLLCTGCDAPHKRALVKEAGVCIKRHGFAACAVAVSLLGRDDDISYTCRFYFKESRVGNCYALEYLTLNGLTTKGRLILTREVGPYGDKQFQCRAGRRARLPDLKNQHVCRRKFRVSMKQINAVAVCAAPAFSRASTAYSSCLITAADSFGVTNCYIAYVHDTNIAYINCIVPHGVPAVAVGSLAIGSNALNCPVLRRDSYVGPCKAADYVDLIRLKEIDLRATYVKVLLAGACNYKK